MARLIDADYKDICIPSYINEEDVDDILVQFPTVDAVEVVRCEDCRHKDFRYYDKESVFCYMSGKYRHINDFCSYGAKMTK